ncbi:helix-turn-helix domain-containing protein [Streptomyces marincola]|uniref:helix-turn-helix domain-containing protein n=1 Tax=Streptomyces marincola TaxID=2878388 RepID=UPI001CF45BEB|nr:helix-turn-helix domain-containing protein [Streptomyces marincola]UCM87725.1 LuxR C-terminal-related transcriptional regulator [Streptomyces marincola]
MLQAAGLTTDEEAVYRELVAVEAATPHEVAARTGLTAECTERVLASLERRGMANRSGRGPVAWAASPPDVALLPQLRQRAEALEEARAAVADLLETYRGTRRHDAARLIEVVTGTAAMRQRLRQIQRSARHEALWFCKAQYVAMPSGTNTAEFDALARGVRYRVLYERAFFEDAGAVDNVVAGMRAGEEARSVPHLPLRMAIVDRRLALCPLVPGGPHGSPREPTAALVRESSLLHALLALFERYWADGVPLGVGTAGAVTVPDPAAGTPLGPEDRRLLSLLVAGLADKAIASQLQLSTRTVQRRVQQLMRLTGAASRMQLAWLAGRKGLI